MVKDLLLKEINEAADNLKVLQEASALHEEFVKMMDLLVETYKKSGALFVAGNGGLSGRCAALRGRTWW